MFVANAGRDSQDALCPYEPLNGKREPPSYRCATRNRKTTPSLPRPRSSLLPKANRKPQRTNIRMGQGYNICPGVVRNGNDALDDIRDL